MIKRESIYWSYQELIDIYLNTVKNKVRALFVSGRHIKISGFVNHFKIKSIKEAKLINEYIKYYRYQFPDEMYPSNLDLAVDVMHDGQIDYDSLDENHARVIKKAEVAGIIKYSREARTFWDLATWQNIADMSPMGNEEQRHIFFALIASIEESLRMYLWECINQKIEMLDILDGVVRICNDAIEVIPSDPHERNWLKRIAQMESW